MTLLLLHHQTRRAYVRHDLGTHQAIGVLSDERFVFTFKNTSGFGGRLARVMHGDVDILTGMQEPEPTRFKGPLWYIPAGRVLSISAELILPGGVVLNDRFASTGSISVYTFGNVGEEDTSPVEHDIIVSRLAQGCVTVFQQHGRSVNELVKVGRSGLVNPEVSSQHVLHYVLWEFLVEQMRQLELFAGDPDALERFVSGSGTTG